MAKGNMLLGQARGKVGDVVFSRNNGQQVIRARSAQVKNPQTTSQILQRILLNTISQAYSKMIAIVDHSTEGVNTGQATMSAFMSRNLNRIRQRVVTHKDQKGSLSGFYAVTPIGMKEIALNNYIMSIGSLPAVPVAEINNPGVLTNMATVDVPGVSETLTYGNLISGFGLRRGDQLTFCTLNWDDRQGITFNYARVILDPVDGMGLPADLDQQLISDGAILAANDRNEGTFARLSEDNGVLQFSVGGGVVVGACVIVSRQDTDGKWLRSNSVLVIPSSVKVYNQYALLEAIDLFYSGGIDFESAYYLNNAESNVTNVTPAATPKVNAISLNGQTILGGTTALEIEVNDSAAIAYTISNFDEEGAAKIVFTTNSATVGTTYNQSMSDKIAALSSASGSVVIDLSTAATYNVYFVSGGNVISKLRSVKVYREAQYGATAMQVDGSDILTENSSKSATNSASVRATIVDYDQVTDPQIFISDNLDKNVGDSTPGGPDGSTTKEYNISSSSFTATFTNDESGTFRVYLVAAGKIAQRCGIIVYTASGSGAGGDEPGEGD